MFGYLRIILALMVLISHTQMGFWGLNVGVVAVAIFYILAGFVFSSLYYRVFSNHPKPLWSLFKNRLLRIYPLYFYALCLCAIFVFVSDYHQPLFTFQSSLAHLLIIPLNYYMFFDFSILQDPKSELNHLTWSLGAELQAYVMLAMIFRVPFLRPVFFMISLVVFGMAASAWVDTDIYGYRLIVGVFFIFMLGMIIERILYAKSLQYQSVLLIILLVIIIFIGVQKSFHVMELKPFTREVLVGVALGIPLVFILALLSLKLPLDRFLGSLSYAIFLTHTPSIWILDYIGIPNVATWAYVGILSVLSVALGIIGMFCFEKPLQKLFEDLK